MSLSFRAVAAIAALAGAGASQVSYDVTKIGSPAAGFLHDFGARIDVCDVDGDGFGDVLIAEPGGNAGPVPNGGRLWLYRGPVLTDPESIESGQAERFEFLGATSNLAPSPSFSDVDADGHVDIVMPAPLWNAGSLGNYIGRVHVFFGPDWEDELILADPILTDDMAFGAGLAIIDLDGDGLGEVIVAGPQAEGLETGQEVEGRIRVFSGAHLARREAGRPKLVQAPPESEFFGWSIRQGKGGGRGPDLIWVAARGYPGLPPTSGVSWGDGAALLMSGDGLFDVEDVVQAPPPFKWFGDVRFHGDLDGDAVDDLVVTAPEADFEQPGPDVYGVGAVVVLKGPEYESVLHELWPPDPEYSKRFGLKTLVLDVDWDGDVDIVVGDQGDLAADVGRVVIFLGPAFDEWMILDSPTEWSHHFGVEIATGDLDGDGLPELLVTGHNHESGRVAVFSPRTLEANRDEISVSLGDVVTFDVDLGPARAGDVFWWIITTAGSGDGQVLAPGSWLPFETDIVTLMGLSLLAGPSGVLDSDGVAKFSLTWPPGFAAPLVGETLSLAVLTSPDGTRPGPCTSAVTFTLVP